MSECNHNCESCTSKCAQAIEKEKLNAYSSVKKVYAVVSGKGGVGKSLVTGLLSALASKTQKTAILDAGYSQSINKPTRQSFSVTVNGQFLFVAIMKETEKGYIRLMNDVLGVDFC